MIQSTISMGFIQLKLPKKIKRKLPNTARRRKALAFHERWLKKRGLDTKSLKKRLKTWTGYPFPDLSTDPNYPKCSDKIPVGTGVKKQNQQYSGKRKLLGIGIMHKSNLVPIWDEEGAKEISKMRRN